MDDTTRRADDLAAARSADAALAHGGSSLISSTAGRTPSALAARRCRGRRRRGGTRRGHPAAIASTAAASGSATPSTWWPASAATDRGPRLSTPPRGRACRTAARARGVGRQHLHGASGPGTRSRVWVRRREGEGLLLDVARASACRRPAGWRHARACVHAELDVNIDAAGVARPPGGGGGPSEPEVVRRIGRASLVLSRNCWSWSAGEPRRCPAGPRPFVHDSCKVRDRTSRKRRAHEPGIDRSPERPRTESRSRS